MSELIKIGNQEMSMKEWDGKRVVTFADIDKVHERRPELPVKDLETTLNTLD